MLTDSDKRTAALAVSRYGADRMRVEATALAMLEAQTKGVNTNLLDRLVGEKLLSTAQAGELRLTLETTQMATPTPPAAAATTTELRQLGLYRILRRLGEGGMGAVYLAYDEGAGRQVAIKVLPDLLAENQSYVERFCREAKSVEQLDHPNIVRFIAVGQDPATAKHYLVLEYVEGPSAHALLRQLGRLSIGDATHIILGIARALEHAHSRSIIHRDIKPDNILITLSGVAKLADLGLAKRVDQESSLTGARQGFGTPFYMPYEQAYDAKCADARSDIYALGATYYHLLTGQVPFTGVSHLEVAEMKNVGVFPPASSINPEIPYTIDRILDKMLARKPQDRYQSASELIVDLERTGLAAAVPSFVDADKALADPLVQDRLLQPAQPTRIDPDFLVENKRRHTSNPNVWYLRQQDGDGRLCKIRMTTWEVVRALQQGRVSVATDACQDPEGDFQPLKSYPQFAPLAKTGARREISPGTNGELQDLTNSRTPKKRTVIGTTYRLLPLLSGVLAILAIVLALVFYAWNR